MARERKRTEEDRQTSRGETIALCHTPIQGGRQRKCRGRAEKVSYGFKSVGFHRQVKAPRLVLCLSSFPLFYLQYLLSVSLDLL